MLKPQCRKLLQTLKKKLSISRACDWGRKDLQLSLSILGWYLSCVAIIPCLSDVGTKVRNFYKETGKLSKRLFDLRWSFLTTFTKARIHNMWQECENVAKIFQREGGGVTLCQTNETHQIVKSTSMPCLLGKILISKTYHGLLWTETTGFQLCPNGKKMCDKKMWGVIGTPGCCSEKQSGKLRKFKAHSHLPPHCPPTWKYTNHFSLTTSSLN